MINPSAQAVRDFQSRVIDLENHLSKISELVSMQADDEGLWFDAETAPEGYLQQELRKLHKIIEGVNYAHNIRRPTL